jgi:hypothetical protein
MLARISLIVAPAAALGLLLASQAGGASQQELCFGVTPTIAAAGEISGTMGDDVILGSEGPDTVLGLAGNDKICGAGGDDRIGGGPGNDELDGGPGTDDLDGGPGNDTILGGDGDDTIRCGADADTADGGPGVNTAEVSGFAACESVKNASAPDEGPAVVTRTLRADLSASKVVPRPKGAKPAASGRLAVTATETESGAALVWRLTFTGLSGAAQAAHVHAGTPGQTGRVLVVLCAPCKSGASGAAEVNGQPARMAIFQGNAYVEIHTKRNPKGELRGQIVRVDQ